MEYVPYLATLSVAVLAIAWVFRPWRRNVEGPTLHDWATNGHAGDE